MLNREEYNATFHHDLTQEEFDKIVPITLDGSNAKTIESLSFVDKETKEVVEFVRVVRCKNCRHMKTRRNIYVDGTIEYVQRCEINKRPFIAEYFCADGKPRETVTPENETV